MLDLRREVDTKLHRTAKNCRLMLINVLPTIEAGEMLNAFMGIFSLFQRSGNQALITTTYRRI